MGSTGHAAKRPTIAAVASHAGVSAASVSRFLNDDPKVSSEMRRRIGHAIRETGYTPNAAARSLRAGSTRQISLVVEDIGNPAYVEAMRSLQEIVQEHGFRLLVESTYGELEKELKAIQSLAEHRVDGLVLFSTGFAPRLIEELRAPAVPVIVVGSTPEGVEVDSLGSDAHGGARRAAQHLAERGCRRLAMVAGPHGTLPGRTRLEGFLAGLDDDVERTEPQVVHASAFTRDAGYEAAGTLLDSDVRPDGIVCANDQLAVGTLNACLDAGLRVPEDVALVGMDNSRDATICRPQLSSVDLRFSDRGRLAGQMLLDRIQGRYEGAPRRQRVFTNLVVRGSSSGSQEGR